MPAQKRSSNHRNNNNEEPSSQHRPSRRKQSTTRAGTGTGTAVDQLPTSQSQQLLMPLQQEEEVQEQEKEKHLNDDELQQDQPAMNDQDPVEETQQDDSDGSGTDPEEFDDMITVLRSELRNNVQCPICLGIIKKTRTVMGCLHRFCRECIDKSMRLGNNECPACRIHCASRRSLRDDQDFDSFIEAIYPDAEKYEEEELMFGEEDKTRNQQIQASIEQISRRQSEALYKKRKSGKEVDDSSQLQIPRPCYNSYSRRRKKTPKIEVEEFDDNDNDGHENPSSSGNHGTETKQKMRKKRRTGGQPSTGNGDGSTRSFGNKAIQMSEEMSVALKAVRKSENLTWGRGGTRSSRLYRGNPLSKLIDCLEDVITAEAETEVRSTTASLENGKNPSSEKPIVTSNSGLSINQVLEPKPQPKPESPEAKVPTEGVSRKIMITSNESAVKPETSMDVLDPSKSTITSNESAVKSETLMDVPDPSKSMKTPNESAVKAETTIDIVPYPSSPDGSPPEVGLQILDQKENADEEATGPSENYEHLAGDINA